MATQNTDLAANQKNPEMGSRNKSVLQFGNVTVAIAKVSLSGTSAADIVDVVKIPQGAVIVKDLCKIVSSGDFTALSLDMRFKPDDGSSNLVLSATTDVSSAGRHWDHNQSTDDNKLMPSDGWIQAVQSLNDGIAGDLTFIIAYAVVS